MGGHGGLNILPQKRWNVYNWDNREKVKRDEEAAAREEQLRLEQTRRTEADLRLQSLRRARGLATASASTASTSEPVESAPDSDDVERKEGDSRHMNLFESLPDFEFLGSVERRETKKAKREEAAGSHKKEHKRRREEKEKAKEAKIIAPEDEKYRLGYGLVGKGVHKPWYLTKPASYEASDGDKEASELKGKNKKKSIEELREERVKRERTEKERERKLLRLAGRKGFSR
ncbi:Leukocyte receptor cluster member 1 [Rhynchospora pubera]|uniref:Leukocyte receptor cluster member 1 n=1 Tax=Rhynchospora pubera TaxID=906938 RepID=A0AAV8E227_9POAL|nr:Leukocyte receptor cluster member 1 [Rhynchospora pubera]